MAVSHLSYTPRDYAALQAVDATVDSSYARGARSVSKSFYIPFQRGLWTVSQFTFPGIADVYAMGNSGIHIG